MITSQRHYFRSFAGGEIAPEMYGRFDLVKNQTGLKRCYNFMVTPQGIVEKRCGSEFVAVANSADARLETFVFEGGQAFSYLIELGQLYARVYVDGAVVQTLVTPYAAADTPSLSSAQFVNDLTLCHNSYPPAVLRRIDNLNWTYGAITFNATLAAPGGMGGVANIIAAFPAGDPLIAYRYNVTTLDSDGRESAVSSGVVANNALRIAGNNNTITWSGVANAFRYNVYCSRGSNGTPGFIGSSDGTSFVDDNISPDDSTRPPAVLNGFTVGNYPAQVAFHEQRAIFANLPAEPQSFYASGLAGFDYFKASVPPQDDQAFTYQISAKKASPIRHIMALRDVLFFTGSGVFRVYSDQNAFAPGSISAIQVSAYGAAANIRPQEAGNAILFPNERGQHLLSLRYDGSGEGYAADDVSIIAPHLIDGYSWVQTAFQRAPYPVWWGLRSDGKLIGLTYVAEQQVSAWFQIELPDAEITSIAVVPEAANDTLYAVVQRVINGNSVTYIERLKPRFGDTQAQQDAFFVDCGITYSGAATTTITGLDHLEGEEVVALAEGQPMGPYTVVGGQITIDELSSTVHVGKRFAGELELLPLSYEVAGLGVGVDKTPSAVHIRMKRSEGITAGSSFSHLYPLLPQVTELIGNITPLRDGVEQVTIDGEWTNDASVVIRQDLPLPAIITGVALDFAGAE